MRAGQRTADRRLGRDFHAVQAAAFLNGVGTRCGQLAVAWWSLGETGSPAVFSGFVALGTAAEIGTRGLLGRLGDTYRPDRLIALCYLLSSATVAVLAALYAGGLYHPLVLALGLALLGLSNGVREPLQTTVVRALVPVRQVEQAMRRRGSVTSITSLLGPIVASVLLGLWGTGPTLAVNAAAVACGLVLMRTVRTTTPARRGPGSGERSRLRTWYRGTREGFGALYRIKSEFHLALLALVVNLGLYPVFAVLLPSLTRREFPHATWLVGIVEGAFGAGLLLGSLGAVARLTRPFGRFTVVIGGFGLTGGAILCSGIAGRAVTRDPALLAAVLVPCFLVGGIGLIMITVTTSTVRVLATPEGMRNRITSSAAFLSGLAVPLGNVLGGVLAQGVGEAMALTVFGALIIAATVTGSRSSGLRRVLTLPDDALPDAYPRLYPRAFRATPDSPARPGAGPRTGPCPR
ncbi:MFS family permease [Streptomyces griseochromogenes]|uniref:MFS family permease n=1 Tax=Streptomyces griseochromogenes TaxID=68214 RepID=A0ABS4LX24_9ACTN|nr:MFS transporter [Streptomyces griseochromogenes]MBP2051969.1 MFS family permease [Streptomyces griseochromogenes]